MDGGESFRRIEQESYLYPGDFIKMGFQGGGDPGGAGECWTFDRVCDKKIAGVVCGFGLVYRGGSRAEGVGAERTPGRQILSPRLAFQTGRDGDERERSVC